MLLNDYSMQALVLESRTAVCAACVGLGWCLVCMGSAQSFGCRAGDRMPPVSENSVPTACPGKLLSSMGRGTITLRVTRVLRWSGRASTWDLRVSEHELEMLGMKEQFDSPELCQLVFPSH